MIRVENEEKIWHEVVRVLQKEEKDENPEEKVICRTCGNDSFRVYISVVIDDARLYCTKCGKDPEEDPSE